MLYLARDRDNSLHLFGPGSPPFFDNGLSQVSLEDDCGDYFGPLPERELNGISIKPETVILVTLNLSAVYSTRD